MDSPPPLRSFTIKFHHGGVFVRKPDPPSLLYDFDMVSTIKDVDLHEMGFDDFMTFLETECTAVIKSVFCLIPGEDLDRGLVELKTNADFNECVRYAASNNNEIDIYVSHNVFELNDNNEQEGNDCASEDDDPYDYYTSDEDDTASLDHLSEGEEEIHEVRIKKQQPKPKKKASNMFDENFLNNVFNMHVDEYAAEREVVIDENTIDDSDKLGDQWPIHDPSVKWKYMVPQLGERYENPAQLKRALAFYGLAKGHNLYYEVNNKHRILAKCSKDNLKRKCPFRLWASWMKTEKSFQIKTLVEKHSCARAYEFPYLVNSNWIARNYAKKVMVKPWIKIKDLQAAIYKKYKCRVTFSLARRGKQKALKQYEACLEDHYAKLRPYAQEIINSNPGSSAFISVDTMPDGKSYFRSFYVCFKGLKDGWLAGCRRVIGLDGCFLKTICKGELLSAVGRDANNQIFPIAWAVVDVENKQNWIWFMECLVADLKIDYGEGVTIISDQHKV